MIFAYIRPARGQNSVDGYAEAIAAREDERFRRRRALAELLLGVPAVDGATAREARELGGLVVAARDGSWRAERRSWTGFVPDCRWTRWSTRSASSAAW